jgi:hypothetical protein
MWIIVEDGHIFEGDEKQWADCFFTNVTEQNVREFCDDEGFEVEIREGGKPNDFHTRSR